MDYNGIQVNIAIVNGLKNADELIEKIQSGEKQYHFVEVMACPNGCVCGGGQPMHSAGPASAGQMAYMRRIA